MPQLKNVEKLLKILDDFDEDKDENLWPEEATDALNEYGQSLLTLGIVLPSFVVTILSNLFMAVFYLGYKTGKKHSMDTFVVRDEEETP